MDSNADDGEACRRLVIALAPMTQHTYRDQERSRAAAWKSATALLSIEARADARYIGKTGAPCTPSYPFCVPAAQATENLLPEVREQALSLFEELGIPWHSGCGGGPSNHLAVMTVAWDLHYDRRVSDGFLDHFLNGGVAHSLVEYARFAPYPLDLQMRHDPKTGAEHATLYVGLTSVLGVKRKKDLLQLEGHKSPAAAECGFQADWAKPMTAEELRTVWRAVEDYLEAIIPIAAAKHASKEGAVQAAASVFSSNKRIMVDREVRPSLQGRSNQEADLRRDHRTACHGNQGNSRSARQAAALIRGGMRPARPRPRRALAGCRGEAACDRHPRLVRRAGNGLRTPFRTLDSSASTGYRCGCDHSARNAGTAGATRPRSNEPPGNSRAADRGAYRGNPTRGKRDRFGAYAQGPGRPSRSGLR